MVSRGGCGLVRSIQSEGVNGDRRGPAATHRTLGGDASTTDPEGNEVCVARGGWFEMRIDRESWTRGCQPAGLAGLPALELSLPMKTWLSACCGLLGVSSGSRGSEDRTRIGGFG